MNPAGWQEVKRILQAALELPPKELSAYLDQACCSGPDLRREVEAYLGYKDMVGAVFGVTGWQSEQNGADEVVADPGRAGPYRILRRIAEGGMGIVYLAERDDGQYRQQVAVKVMKAEPQDAGLMRRFPNERQILAELNHPNIARLIDGGTIATGQLYYVMEYVDGVPVTTYCNARRLALRQRVQLFSAICLAVVHAHRKLIVHGDVKPANILVCSDGTPKVVDFGLAKVFRAAPEAGEAPPSTTLMLTPGYASPEQITGGRLGMAADVYSLGVLLCELINASSPYALTGKTPFEVCRAVLDEDPRPPSAILGHRSRSAEPEIPIAPRQLKGDLDAIVLKALRKEPESRYGSVEELRDEIERYLAGLPVRASRGNRLYRCRKFVKRRTWALAAAAVIAIGAISAATIVWWEGRQAEMRFNDVRALAHSVVIFELHDAIQDLPGSTAARKLLVQRGLEYLRKLESNGGARHDLQLELASAYQRSAKCKAMLPAAASATRRRL
jgi:serine/threonine protein kinase